MIQVEISPGVVVHVSQQAINKATKAFSCSVISHAHVAELARAEGDKTVLAGYSQSQTAAASRARKTAT